MDKTTTTTVDMPNVQTILLDMEMHHFIYQSSSGIMFLTFGITHESECYCGQREVHSKSI